MLAIEYIENFSAHIKLSKSEINVNTFVNYCEQTGKRISQKLFVDLILKVQTSILAHYLGRPWQKNSGKLTPWACPVCAARSGFSRRGKRTRKLKTSLGNVLFALLQVTCPDCLKTFSPFPEILGIGSRRQITRELEQKVCDLIRNLSYNKSATLANEIFKLKLSPYTIHRSVQHYGSQAKIMENLSHISHLQTDSTKINASANDRGIDVHLALCIGPSEKKNGRIFRHKTLATVQVSDSPIIMKELLTTSQVDQLTVDGKSGLEKFVEEKNIATTIQRCLWHIPKTAAHMMYMDGKTIPEGREFTAPLKYFLFDENLSVKKRLEKYDLFIQKCQIGQFNKTANFLKNARENLFTYKQFDDHDLHGRTNSVIERQMREINRRMENGSRWSAKGAENLLKLKLIQELNTDSYRYLWKLPKIDKTFNDVILC